MDLKVLEHTELFRGITKQDIEHLLSAESYEIINYTKDSVIHFQNEKCTALDIIIDGIIAIQRIDHNGNYISIGNFSSGKTLGGNLLFSQHNHYPMTIITKTKASIIQLKQNTILHLCQNSTKFLTNFLRSLSDNTLILTDKIKTLSYKSIRQCLIEFLRYESFAQKSQTIVLKLSKKELAERFGVQRSSLSRELQKMRREGLLTYDARSITILAPEKILLDV